MQQALGRQIGLGRGRVAAAAPAPRRRCASVRVAAVAPEYAALNGCKVVPAAGGQPVDILSLWPCVPGRRAVVVFLTHFGDLTTWELGRALKLKALQPLEEAGVQVITVGLGEPANARAFASASGYPSDHLYADTTAACYSALGFTPGFLAGVDGVDPYLKLLPMLAGIGSPGTVQEVLRGYVGDRSAPPIFDGTLGKAFGVLGEGYQRPFELATLRLQNMASVLSKWGELAPSDRKLLTQQGGVLVFDGCDLLYKHSDPGILRYAPPEEVLAAALGAPQKLITKQRE
ncbi:hypothetical protein Rsub_02173 [Raphidocelis subcapitata]|uniref:Uncharacterized protein n=1 Tax=Raphidocelis subcapitata TaxID=307507 RepID=A0A2V0NNZ0_9CHLO|nr:hypothetical protein Rsub_02173 [Raphidocelis subcapitata]|eukprot:GBF89296.1 hypothetical protein Rsub_02173 [Raphidocelis subcapitata]